MSTTNDDTENLIPPDEPQTLPFWARAVAWSTGMLGAVILAFAGITSLVVNILSVRGKGSKSFFCQKHTVGDQIDKNTLFSDFGQNIS